MPGAESLTWISTHSWMLLTRSDHLVFLCSHLRLRLKQTQQRSGWAMEYLSATVCARLLSLRASRMEKNPLDF